MFSSCFGTLYQKYSRSSHAAFFVNLSVIKLMELFIVSIITTIQCVLLYLRLDYFSQVQPSFMCGTRDEQDFSLLVQCHLWSSQFSLYLCNLFLLVGFLYFNVTTSLWKDRLQHLVHRNTRFPFYRLWKD